MAMLVGTRETKELTTDLLVHAKCIARPYADTEDQPSPILDLSTSSASLS